MDTQSLTIGLDVGSTTVKAVVCNEKLDILWKDYQRHEARQQQKVNELLAAVKKIFGHQQQFRLVITGSGGGALTSHLKARFIQEVNAVSLAVEYLHPAAGSVIELGGQDAKIILFKASVDKNSKRKILSMNDKCAGGTGTVIDKIRAKLNIQECDLPNFNFDGVDTHAVAAKCGVFAETDINGLQKNGVPPEQLMASLYGAIVQQNLSVLTRGNTLEPEVILLGGPNMFLPGLVQAWRHHIRNIWLERGCSFASGKAIDEMIYVPNDAQYYAALGAVIFAHQNLNSGLEKFCLSDVLSPKSLLLSMGKIRGSGKGLTESSEALLDFKQQQQKQSLHKQTLVSVGEEISVYLGVDCGSTSTKAVLIDDKGHVMTSAYQLSSGNPIEDSKQVLGQLHQSMANFKADLKVKSCVTTGYAKDVLKSAIGADAALVETVAHTKAALHFYPEVDVICDVGGQDIKIIMLKDGRIKDFRLNTQCSAGNGYFLQNTAQTLGLSVDEYADRAFNAQDYPEFGYGCSVFMQSDIVDFQRQGWSSDEILAGLAAVLPKNIWLYVAAIPNMATLGKTFLLQGGTQKNLAAVKAQSDFIQSRFKGSGVDPTILVHQYCAESGAIGAALEARRINVNLGDSDFIGFNAVRDIQYRIHNDERTVCDFCKNKCQRTFIDVKVADSKKIRPEAYSTLVPIEKDELRIISGNSCEKGLVEQLDDMKVIKKKLDQVTDETPNLVQYAAKQVWKTGSITVNKQQNLIDRLLNSQKTNIYHRDKIRIGIPRVLNNYSLNPLFSGYFRNLGIRPRNIVYSSFTDENMYREGAKRSSIDPCFSSKVAISHINQLMFGRGKKKPLDLIFFPMINSLDSSLSQVEDHAACPTVTVTPEVVKAAMTKEEDLFAKSGIQYINPMLNVSDRALFERQMFNTFADLLGISRKENKAAVLNGFDNLSQYKKQLQQKGKAILDSITSNDQISIVILARAYHNDPGINHEIPDQLQALGYPILSIDSLPVDDEVVSQVFEQDLKSGRINSGLEIGDVWKNAYSENTSQKVWAAKFIARHPNLVALELSSFKCGHDAPVYQLIEKIIESSGTPYFCFKDLDENKPSASINIRIETIHYFLQRYKESLVDKKKKEIELNSQMLEYEQSLRSLNKTPQETSLGKKL